MVAAPGKDGEPVAVSVDPGEGEEVRLALEEMWCDEKSTPAVVAIGGRGSGKSFLTNKMIRAAMAAGAIDKLFGVIPVHRHEASGSYAWFSLPEFKDRIFVSEAYSPSLTQQLLDREITDKSSRLCYWIDDLAAADSEIFWKDPAFSKLLVVSRHKKTAIVLCNHSVSSGHTLPGMVRQNVSHIILLRVSNRRLLEGAFEEWLSLHPTFQGNFKFFLKTFTDLSSQGPGSGICIDLAGKAPGKVALAVRDWWAEFAPDKGVGKVAAPTAGPVAKRKKAGDSSSSSSSDDNDARKKDGRPRDPKRRQTMGNGAAAVHKAVA